MTATNPAEQTALTLPERAAVALGETANAAKLRELAKQSANIVTVTNPDGREEAHRAGMVLRTTRTNITNTGKAAREDATAFSKAVIAMEKDLIAIIQPEEDRVLALRDKFDEQLAAEKAAKIAAERARVEKIQSTIDNIKAAPVRHMDSDSAALAKAVEFYLVMPAEESEFAEFTDEVKQAIGATLEKLREMGIVAAGKERAARDAEAARIAEAERLAAERAENARIAAENAKAAAELAAERKRMADEDAARQAAAAATQKEADAKAQAARDEQARAAAAQQAIIDAQIAAMAEQSRKLAEQQAAADARDAAALAKQQAEELEAAKQLAGEQQREKDHGPALMMNAEFDVAQDAAAEAERARLQGLAERALADESEPQPSVEVLMADAPDPSPFDGEIIELVAEHYGWNRVDAIDRLQAIDFDAARQEAV